MYGAKNREILYEREKRERGVRGGGDMREIERYDVSV